MNTLPVDELATFVDALSDVRLDGGGRRRVVAAAVDLVAQLDAVLARDLGEMPPANGVAEVTRLDDTGRSAPLSLPGNAGSIASWAQAMRDGSYTAVELVTQSLERIGKTEPTVHAWTHLDVEGALAAAARADEERAAGIDRGALHGVPVGIKDLIDVEGMPITAGSRQLVDRTSVTDATAVARLREAGAIVLGKTNTHEFALGGTTPPTRNPWALDRVPGGSSGGSAAAVAAGHCLLALGTDTAGSIRIPSSFCGVVGLKPTAGRVPRDGVLPMAWAVDAVGPIAREVTDLAVAMHALSGRTAADPYSSCQSIPDFGARLGSDLSGLRIGVPRLQFFEPAEAEILSAVEEALAVLTGLGASIEDVVIDGADTATAFGMVIFLAEAAEYHRTRLRETPELFEEETSQFIESALLVPATAYVRALRMQRLLAQSFDELLRKVDVLVMPTMPCAPAPYGAHTFDELPVGGGTLTLAAAHIRNNLPSSLAGLPAGTQPCGLDRHGTPIGMQLVGAAWQEPTVLQVMHAYESATEWHLRQPPLAPP